MLGHPTLFTASFTAGSNINYAWDFGDGTTGTGNPTTHTYGTVGNYTATITATNSVSVVTTTTPVTITDVPIMGLSAANSSPTELGQATFLTATIAAGSNVIYQWDFGDGDMGTGLTTTHTYGEKGDYLAVVTATNSVGVITATTTVTVFSMPVTSGYQVYLPLVLNNSATAFVTTGLPSTGCSTTSEAGLPIATDPPDSTGTTCPVSSSSKE